MYRIQVEQVDAMSAQLILLHQCKRCVGDPEFFGDEAKEEVNLQAGLRKAHPSQAGTTAVSELLSVVIVLLFLNAESCENNVPIHGGMNILEAGASGQGKAEIDGNDSKCCGHFEMW